MKRYLALASYLLLCASAYAQIERMPFGDKMNYNVNKIDFTSTKGATTPTASIFIDDFEGANYQLTDKWQILRSPILDFQVSTDASNPCWFLCTPQSFNGNGSTYIKHGEASTAISFTAPDFTWLITRDTLSIPNDTETYLKFWVWYYSNYEQNYITHFYVISYDVDNKVLDTLLYYGKDQSTSVPNQYKSLVNLSLQKVQGKNVRLAFVYENRNNQNRGTQLAIDEVCVTNLNIPDIDITAIPYKYSKIPYIVFDSLEIDLKVNAYNQGITLNDTLNISGVCPKIEAFQASAQITDTLESGEQRVVTLSPRVKLFPQAESYKFIFDATTPPDTLTDNNTDSINIEISNSIYATDRGILKGGISFNANTYIGNLYEFQRANFIEGVEIGWAQNTSIPESNYPLQFLVSVVEVNPATPQNFRVVSQEQFPKEFSANGGSIIYYLQKPVYCYQGFSYFILIKSLTDNPLGIGYDGNPYGGFWKIDDIYSSNATYMANQSIGNLAVRTLVSAPVESPTVFFNIKNELTEPAQNVKIRIEELDSTITTNAQGQATIKLSNGQYSYSIDSTGYSSLKKKFSVFSQNLVINDSLVKNYLVKFKVVDENSTPLDSASIIAYPFELTTNENGEDSTWMPSGTYMLNVLLSGYKMKYPVNLLIENKDTLYTIVMEPAITHKLTVEVINQQNEKLPNAQVFLMNYGTLLTNSEGICSFNGLLPGMVMGSIFVYNYFDGFIFMDLTSDSTITVTLNPYLYTATFYVTSKGKPIINAEIIIEGLDTLHTGLNGYGQSDFIPFGNNIPFTVKIKDYHTYSGTFNIWDSNVLIPVNLTPLGVEDENASVHTSIYPNPCSDFIKISTNLTFTITIYDLNGKLVYLNSSPSSTVDISTLPKGLYIVKLLTPQGISVHKILKN